MATVYKIHPAIGIARLGNSPESYPGPTLPGVYTPPASYRDVANEKKLKRQSVSFSVYAYDDANPNAETAGWPGAPHGGSPGTATSTPLPRMATPS